MVTLKDHTQVDDPRLDRLVEFDDRSRGYPIRTVLRPRSRARSYTWRILPSYLIDQGSEGACVGFAITNELMARPAEVVFDDKYMANDFARANIYWQAQRIDPWEGGAYPGASPRYEGTSVLSGMKVAKELGYFSEYRWAFGIDELVLGLSYNGPAVLGLTWYDSNYTPDSKGFVRPVGRAVGGHAILARAIKVIRSSAGIDYDKSYVTLRNSWGEWGILGDCFVTLRDLATWLEDRGEACFAVKRTVNV